MSIFIVSDQKTSIIHKKKKNPDNREYQIRRQGFLEAGCEGTLSASSVLPFVPRCLQSALSAAQSFALVRENLIYSTLFVAGGNNTLELISN